ncbi:MAG: Co2+/Mg2+ efflux protein ApaG [Rickettsiales bacterium]|nr:Co2+/Mg2+ efflux protein ApaG [Rickettsiales bacterium]
METDDDAFDHAQIYTRTTHAIKVTALPVYLAEQSEPEEEHYVWAYTIFIENHSKHTVTLLNRTWNITDAEGQQQTVHGPGVVGEQPELVPGGAFHYTSGTVLHTPSGLMYGTYEMEDHESKQRFDVVIPAFSLDSPQAVQRAN